MLPKYGQPRLKFPNGEQRKFLELVFEKSRFDARKLAKIVNLSPRTIRDWNKEKFNISEEAVKVFCKQFDIPLPNNKELLIESWKRIKLNASRNGGVAHFRLYGSPATLEGCRKGGSHALKILRDRGIIAPYKHFSLPPRKSSALAEFIGIMLGDGGLTRLQATITLNSEADKDYIQYVRRLGVSLFKDEPSIYARRDCKATNLLFSGIKLVEYLTEMGLQIGDKVKNQVKVPIWIQNSKFYRIACLRGLMDTDGCISKCTHHSMSKKYVYYNPCFTNASKPLLEFVRNTLISAGFNPSVTGRHVWLYNKAELGTYFRVVGSNNTRLSRFQESIPNGSGDGSLNHIA